MTYKGVTHMSVSLLIGCQNKSIHPYCDGQKDVIYNELAYFHCYFHF